MSLTSWMVTYSPAVSNTQCRGCANSQGGTYPLDFGTDPFYITFVPERPTMFDELWSEIQDAPGEIFDMDIPELRDEKFDVNEYLNSNYDY